MYNDGIILVSGGMDSMTLMHMLKHQNPNIKLMALNMYYGQRHEIEMEYCKYNCTCLNIPYNEVKLNFYNDIIKDVSAMVGNNNIEVPNKEYDPEETPVTYAPFRNALFITIAAAYAESNGMNTIYYAAHKGDEVSNYWDCSDEFFDKMNALLSMRDIKLVAPFINIKKVDIAKIAKDIPTLDLSKTWSCYKGDKVHCGVCSTCRERILAIRDAGIEDKTEYLENPYK